MKSLVFIVLAGVATLGYSQETYKEYYDNGAVKAEYVENGEEVKFTTYFENGKVRETGMYISEEKHGEWLAYDRLGNMRTHAYYDNGEKVGSWTVFSIQGEILAKMVYNHGDLVSYEYNKEVNHTAYIE